MESCARAVIGKHQRNDEGRILCSMPGRFGDILWALPTVRAISEYHGKPVSFVTAFKYRSIVDLLRLQDYIDQAFVDPFWQVTESAPITPREPKTRYDGYDWQYHLGYPDWPTCALPIYVRGCAGLPGRDGLTEKLESIRLRDPWIRLKSFDPPVGPNIAVGFSPKWIELKMGVLLNLAAEFDGVHFDLIVPDRIGSRIREWTKVFPGNVSIFPCSWTEAARCIVYADVFLGCLSAMWVLANAVGQRTVIFEPAEGRHHPIFWVDRYDDHNQNQNHLVRGVDGEPTFDARHVINDLDDALTSIWHSEEVSNGKTTEPDNR